MNRDQTGEKNSSYKDGRVCKLKYWIKTVLERDNYTCQDCYGEKKSKRMVSTHHIKKKKTHSELIYDLDNGLTLCDSCHVARHNKERTGISLSVCHRRKLSVSWNSPGFTGHHHSAETKDKMGVSIKESWKNRDSCFSEEHKINLKLAWEKRKRS